LIILTESGIGYEIIINELIYSKIYNKNEVELFIFHSISENSQSLFGFINIEDRKIFKDLIKISGVGGRVAQTILSLGTIKLKQAILNEDKKTLESIKGVGKKMAEKIVIELSDKDFVKNSEFEKTNDNKTIENISNIDSNLKKEIISSLSLMGYNVKDIEIVLQNIPKGFDTVDTIIPYVIKNI
ncbi:MAG: Holliday junction branch migration protein RuvA, partial [Candidatus Gracilibacteria bacterium]|nr:Holliday junction branch migration protein RuvA [Candidatus Gracilibacteria bacterium]